MTHNDKDRLDRWLDSALNEHGKAEPWPGLEARVLANLAAHAKPSGFRSTWPWVSAGAVVAVLFMGVWLGVGHRVIRGPDSAARHPTSAETQSRQPLQEATPTAHMPPAVRPLRHRRDPVIATVAGTSEPRLKQFPSLRPLSEQEKLLVRYVNESPSDAVLIAKEQAARLREMQEYESDSPAGTLGITQQER